MALKRDGNVLLNTDNEAYNNAKKRLQAKKDREQKDRLLESLVERVQRLEKEMLEMRRMINHDFS